MKMQALVISCHVFVYSYIKENSHQSSDPAIIHLLHFYIVMHMCATPKLLHVYEQVKSTCSQVQTIGMMEKKIRRQQGAHVC